MNNQLEIERDKLNQLIDDGASGEEILKQSEVVDKYIVQHYRKSV